MLSFRSLVLAAALISVTLPSHAFGIEANIDPTVRCELWWYPLGSNLPPNCHRGPWMLCHTVSPYEVVLKFPCRGRAYPYPDPRSCADGVFSRLQQDPFYWESLNLPNADYDILGIGNYECSGASSNGELSGGGDFGGDFGGGDMPR